MSKGEKIVRVRCQKTAMMLKQRYVRLVERIVQLVAFDTLLRHVGGVNGA